MLRPLTRVMIICWREAGRHFAADMDASIHDRHKLPQTVEALFEEIPTFMVTAPAKRDERQQPFVSNNKVFTHRWVYGPSNA